MPECDKRVYVLAQEAILKSNRHRFLYAMTVRVSDVPIIDDALRQKSVKKRIDAYLSTLLTGHWIVEICPSSGAHPYTDFRRIRVAERSDFGILKIAFGGGKFDSNRA
jgi:hypothetical protein